MNYANWPRAIQIHGLGNESGLSANWYCTNTSRRVNRSIRRLRPKERVNTPSAQVPLQIIRTAYTVEIRALQT